MGYLEPVFPYKYPALFSMLVAFTGIRLYSIIDNSATGEKEQEALITSTFVYKPKSAQRMSVHNNEQC